MTVKWVGKVVVFRRSWTDQSKAGQLELRWGGVSLTIVSRRVRKIDT
jgi:hypothetical protein